MRNEFTAVVEHDGEWVAKPSRHTELANNLAGKICRALSVPEIGT